MVCAVFYSFLRKMIKLEAAKVSSYLEVYYLLSVNVGAVNYLTHFYHL